MKTAILVLVEVLIVIGLSRLVGTVFRYLKQPLVIGEIAAGIMLGPSLLGIISPELSTWLFPPEAIPFLEVLSEVGLIFFMFLIGLELNPKYLRGQMNVAILTSHVSILVPFTLGLFLALGLYPVLSNASVSFTAFTLFLGSALSITAFPVLARIITEKKLQNTPLGILALTSAAVGDVTAWCLLAVSIAVTQTNSMSAAIPTILLSGVYIGLMFTLGRRFLNKLAKYYERTKRISQLVLAGIYMAVLASALITELIGIHLIFGAFLMGAIMPKNAGLTREIAIKTEEFVLIFLLPIFFAYSGLRTQIGLLNSPELWLICAAIIGVAVVGKYCGTYFAARFCGISKRESMALGWMMNTRGLTELIVLNIGLSLNVISPILFAMLVMMALVTTFMTSPLLDLIFGKQPAHLNPQDDDESEEHFAAPSAAYSDLQTHLEHEAIAPQYRILVPVANPNTQEGLIQLAAAIAVGKRYSQPLQSVAIYPLSLIKFEEEYLFESTPTETNRAIQKRQDRLQELVLSLEPPELRKLIYPTVRVSSDVAGETSAIAKVDRIDLILMGWHRPVFTNNPLGGPVGQILASAPTDVVVFVDRNQINLNRILLPYSGSTHNDLGLELGLRLLLNDPEAHLSILQILTDKASENPRIELNHEFSKILEQLPQAVRDRIAIVSREASNIVDGIVEASKDIDLTIVGASREWGIARQTLGKYTDELASRCPSSLLITRKYNKVTSHLASALLEIETQASNDRDMNLGVQS
ncbi:cation:proton antiporter [Tumidithrix elongata RA019]|uniref:Cation:proton antiporter n=1 Tax=Tumidithrix elongata BACA0141 TaxID=2716417 RepID=A0AAW9PUJ8_9CYAN|nr:cation:proton antiporter [Tumidithrix elongata RA019]